MTHRLDKRPTVLVVRDGWGRNPHPDHRPWNAIELAETPVSDRLLRDYPWTLIKTSGEDVGLPAGTMGNSEVGHQNLGAGRIVDQESVRITKAIRTERFYDNEPLTAAIEAATGRGGAVHLLSIASDAGVHGLLDHLYACLELCRRRGAERVFVHLFTDGRDTGPFTGKAYVEQVAAECRKLGTGRIVTLIGRYWAMDRDHRWQRVERAYRALTGLDEALPHFPDPVAAIEDYYAHPEPAAQRGDEFVTPRTVGEQPLDSRISAGDSVLFVNYRGDRPRELVRAFRMPDFYGHVPPSPDGEQGFDRGPLLELDFVTMTAYQEELNELVAVAFPKLPRLQDTAGVYLAQLGLRQFRCAETEKFPHVTFFFNDYREEPWEGESRAMAPSPRVATYDQKPEMSARQVCDLVLERLRAEDTEDFILVNFANTDMVGHTGSLEAARRAAEVVDGHVGEIVEATLASGGAVVVTADHGNAEQMWDPDTEAPHTAHTTFDVECVIVDPRRQDDATGSAERPSPALRNDGRLCDVFPTMLSIMGLEQPAAMTGSSLLLTDAPAATPTRVEKDLLGSLEVPREAYYGLQTLRALGNFPITGVPISHYPLLVRSLALVKMAAALANRELGDLEPEIANAITAAGAEILADQWHDQFIVDVIQGGAGTSTNMNANEVIANRANELLGGRRGDYQPVHPNNHVNRSQSTNDSYPTAIKIAICQHSELLIDALRQLIGAFRDKGTEFSDVLKMGRTQLQDAVPMTLGQEFEAYAETLGEETERLRENARLFFEVNLGGTAIGTGLNASPEFGRLAVGFLAELTELPLRLSANLVEATQDTGAFVMYSSALKRLAVKLSKICNDLRLLSSGPRAGLNEINLPPRQAGSSIMPGKVNPVIPEVVNQIAFKVIGNDITVTLAAEAGQLELNVMEPVIAQSIFESMDMLVNGIGTLESRCIRGITANRDVCAGYVRRSIGLVTALVPALGYEKASELAKKALAEDRGIYELVLEEGLLSRDDVLRLLDPANML